MLLIKSKHIRLAVCLSVLSAGLLTPALSQAETETGSVAARQAADQKAALAKKAAEREARKAAEAKAAADAKAPAEATAPAEEPKAK